MADDPSPASPTSETPPPRTTGGGFRWEPPTAEELQAMMPGYTIEKILGRGGMGAVYKGVQENLDRTVAIKILPPGVEQEDPSFAERFKSEARFMAKLNHPGVVAVYDFGNTSGGQLYFAMEYVDGTDVAQMIKTQKKLPPDYALAITAHVCDALGAAHELGIVHRDIKPANVLLNMKGQVKVADFGLAKVEEPGTHGLTKTGYAMGTPDFVAPEVLMLGTHIDGRADLYAVGVMLYQMLTGEVPRGAFKPASVLVPGLDRRYDPIIMKAMQSDREERYQSSAELRADLDVILTVPLVQQNAPTGAAAIPAAQVAQAPGQRSMAQKPVGKPPQGGVGTPARNSPPGGAAAKPKEAGKSARAPLFLGLGAAAAVAIGAFVMFSGKKSDAGKEDAPPSAAVPPQTALGGPSASPLKTSSLSSASAQLKWAPVDLSKILMLDDGNKIRRVDNGVLHLAGSGGAALKDASFRNGAIRFTCLWGADFQTMDAALRTQTGSKTAARIRVNDLTFLDLKDGAKGKPAAGTLIKTLDLPKTLKAGAEPVFEFAAVGAVLYAWCDGQLLGQAPTTLLEEGSFGFQASGIGGKIKNLEYLNLDGLSEPEALKVLGLDAKGAAVPAPVPVAAASPSSDKFPPGQWVKVFTKFDDVSQKARNEYKLTWKDGWIDGTASPEGYQQISIPNTQARNQGVRARIKHDPTAAGTFPAGLSLRTTAGHRYTLNYNFADHSARIAVQADKAVRALSSQKPKQVPPDGSEYELELYIIGERLIGRMNGELLPIATDDSIAEGYISFTVKHLIRDLEVINLDGLSEAEALKLAGMDEQGKDLRTPAASPSPSPPVSASSTSKFPPGQWVKVLTNAEEVARSLGGTEAGKATFADGWVRLAEGQAAIFQLGLANVRNSAVRVRILHNRNETGPLGLMLRKSKNGKSHYQLKLARDLVTCQASELGKFPDVFRATPAAQDLPTAGQEYTLEFGAVGDRLVARMGSTLKMATDKRVSAGDTWLNMGEDFRDLEVINLDGLSEAEALKILGVDEKGNDLRAAAIAQEKQAMEQAKTADTMAAIPELKALHDQLVKLTAERVTAPFAAEVAKLNAGYLGGIDREIASEKKAGHLDGIIALEAEKKLIVDRPSGSNPNANELEARSTMPLPTEDAADTTTSLKKLRGIYRAANAKLESTRSTNLKALTDPLTARLKLLEADLTKKDRVNDAKQVKAYREDLGKSTPQGTAVTPNPTPTPISAATTTKEEAKSVRSALPSGVLHGAGTRAGVPFDLSKYGDPNGFVEVASGGTAAWAAMRADGTLISDVAAIHGLKDVEFIRGSFGGIMVLQRGAKGITMFSAFSKMKPVTTQPSSYGGGHVVDAGLAAQDNLIILKEDGTIRLIGPNFPVSKTLQETKAITEVVSVTAGAGWLAALNKQGKVYAWSWGAGGAEPTDEPAYMLDTAALSADTALLATLAQKELVLATKTGNWEIYELQADRTLLRKKGGVLPPNWQRLEGPQLIVVNADRSWTPLLRLLEEFDGLVPKDRPVLDIAVVKNLGAGGPNSKNAYVLWIEPPESAAPKATP